MPRAGFYIVESGGSSGRPSAGVVEYDDASPDEPNAAPAPQSVPPGHSIGARPSLRPVIRPLAAAGIMGGCLIALGRGRSLALTLPVGGGTYLAVLGLMRRIPRETRVWNRGVDNSGGSARLPTAAD